VINAVDGIFQGNIGYAANWDHYQNPAVAAAIWNNPAIDFLGIDAYFDGNSAVLPALYQSNANANAGVPGVGDGSFAALMEQSWDNKLDNEILPYAHSLKGGVGMPVKFTEIGYQFYNLTSREPQNQGGAVDTDEQTAVFQGLIHALDGRKGVFRGLDVWNWGMPGTGSNVWDMGLGGESQPNNIPLTTWLSNYVKTAVPVYAADFNDDGTVDGLDLLAWQQQYGAAPGSGADADADGDVDDDDYAMWAQQFGSGIAGAAAASAPEPANLVLAAIALSALVGRRRKHSATC
jgi:hypothetical protein